MFGLVSWLRRHAPRITYRYHPYDIVWTQYNLESRTRQPEAPTLYDTTPAQLTECRVCGETKDTKLFPASPISSQCTHPPSTCYECVATSIKTELEMRRWDQLSCPECREPLQHQEIKRFADEETFARSGHCGPASLAVSMLTIGLRYDALATRAAMSEDPDFVWCPFGCGSGQIHDTKSNSGGPIFRCFGCCLKYCFKHQCEWHDGLTCEMYDRLGAGGRSFGVRQGATNDAAQVAKRRQEERQSEARIQEISKPCPNCSCPIEKNEGW